MKKILGLIFLSFSLSSCANFTINGTICDDIGVGSKDISEQNIPKECKKYDKEKAYKAYDKVNKKEKADIDDIIEFDKDKEDEKH